MSLSLYQRISACFGLPSTESMPFFSFLIGCSEKRKKRKIFSLALILVTSQIIRCRQLCHHLNLFNCMLKKILSRKIKKVCTLIYISSIGHVQDDRKRVCILFFLFLSSPRSKEKSSPGKTANKYSMINVVYTDFCCCKST